ncbi:MAG: FecR family protein [Bacteroidales bacterium]|nr:FecR family protein [Bacteroidales bacterium]
MAGINQIEYQLPDGSNVSLNADSKITYDRMHFNSDRHLKLEGEAFFDITQGNNFTISTSSGEIKVLGTSFNVFTRNNSFKVSCLTGKILVFTENQSIEIVPGESAELSGDGLISFRDNNLSSVTGWLNGEFSFVNASLVLVFEEIERQFNVKFAGQKIDNRYFTGGFTNKDLRTALEIVCPLMDLKYEIGNNGKIFISERTQ